MAGDWIKVEVELPDKPEVHYMAGILNLDCDAVVGKLLRVWIWFDKHTVDGNAHGVTFALLDRLTGVTGFGEAMCHSGWLLQNGHDLSVPNFTNHNGETAKKRAVTARRVAKHKKKVTQEVTEEVTQPALPNALPREEKRREVNKGQAFALPDWVPEPQWCAYVDMRKKSKKAPTDHAKQLVVVELEKLRATGENVAAVLDQSTMRGWTDVYPVKAKAATAPVDAFRGMK